MNRALFSSHCYLSWGFVVPYFMALVHLTAALQVYVKGYRLEEISSTSTGEHYFGMTIFFPVQEIICTALNYFFLISLESLFPGLLLVTCLAVCTLTELFSMWNLTRIEVQLCNMLSPEAPQLSLASYNWSLVSISGSVCASVFL